MHNSISIYKGTAHTLPIKQVGSWVGYSYICPVKRALQANITPPSETPILHSLIPVPISNVGDGTPGICVVLSSTLTANWVAGPLPYCLQVHAQDSVGNVTSLAPLFIQVLERL